MGCSNDKSLNENNKTMPQNEVKTNINFNIKTEENIKEENEVDRRNPFRKNNKNTHKKNNKTRNNKRDEENDINNKNNLNPNTNYNDNNYSEVEEEEGEEKISYRKQDENLLKNLDREKLKKLVLNCPKRTSIELDDFVDYLVENTKSLKDIEKAYFLFYWMHENIAYDVENYFKGGDSDCTPKGAFRNGKTVCSGYSRLYKYLGEPIGLKVFCVNGYAKDFSYEPGMKIQGTNHEWNIIKIEDSFYQLDSTWGAGKVSDKDKKYTKEFDEFYFCPRPEHIIFTHLPESDDHQLLEYPISKEEFSKRIVIKGSFFKWFTHPDYL